MKSMLILMSYALLVLLLCQTEECVGCMEQERVGLLQLKAALQHGALSRFENYYNPLDTWVDDRSSDCCGWERVRCSNSTHRRVIQLSLGGLLFYGSRLFDLSRFLPFQELRYLDFSENYPGSYGGMESLTDLKYLEVLNLAQNGFNNSILRSFGTYTSLKSLNLSGNRIGDEGHLFPRVFTNLPNLEVLDLSSNIISSIADMGLSNLTKLRILDLSGNFIEGPILESLFYLNDLESLFMRRCSVYGSLSGLGLSNLTKLRILDLSSNSISPDMGLSNLTKLRILDLSKNYMEGSILESLLYLNDLESLFMGMNYFNGSLSGLCKMKNLKDLDLGGNEFEGALPHCLRNLTHLRKLDLSRNQFYGNLPPSLVSNITSLKYISFSDNQLDGALMFSSFQNHKSQFDFLGFSNCRLNLSADRLLSVLYNQHKVTGIELSHNDLHGKFPNWLVRNNTKLEHVILRNNSFEGEIHFSLSRPTNVKFIDISMNFICGKLPTEIGHIWPRLVGLNMSRNNLEGSVPASLGNMKELIYLDLSHNRLDGHIPRSIFNFTNLQILQLSNNQLTGGIPDDAKIEIAVILDIGHNNISGRIPSQMLSGLQTLILRNNFFHGPIPPELCNKYLFHLDLSHNQLSENIPSCLLEIETLHLQHNKLWGTIPNSFIYPTLLDLSHNNLSGNIPNTIGFSEGMRVLLLRGNRLNGSIPHSLCWLVTINLMDLSHNMLSGPIPPCFSNITMFGNISHPRGFGQPISEAVSYFFGTGYGKENINVLGLPKKGDFVTKSRLDSYQDGTLEIMGGLDLSCNKLTGEIPPEIGDLITIYSLNLSHNQLIGSIPKTLSNMKQIESLDLSYNRLTGEIPTDITAITTLEVFTVAYNDLSGRVPERKAQFATFDETSYKGNSLLCGSPLPKQCGASMQPPAVDTDSEWSDEPWMDLISFLASLGATYIMCLLGIAAALYINPYWRRIWFDFVDTCLNFIFPFWSEAIYGTRNPFT